MSWREIKDEKGNVIGHAIVCSHPAPGFHRCGFCGQMGNKLCDYPLNKSRTCDARMCADCAVHVDGKDIDYCPIHKHSTKCL